MTTRSDIREWLEMAQAVNAHHMIVATDTFDYSDYPVFVTDDLDTREELARITGKDMTKVMEVYDLSLSIDAQLTEHRAWHL